MSLSLQETPIGPAHVRPAGSSLFSVSGLSKILKHCERHAQTLVDAEAVVDASHSPFYFEIPGVASPTERIGSDAHGLVYRLTHVVNGATAGSYGLKLFADTHVGESASFAHCARLITLEKPQLIEPLLVSRRLLLVSYDVMQPSVLQTYLLSK